MLLPPPIATCQATFTLYASGCNLLACVFSSLIRCSSPPPKCIRFDNRFARILHPTRVRFVPEYRQTRIPHATHLRMVSFFLPLFLFVRGACKRDPTDYRQVGKEGRERQGSGAVCFNTVASASVLPFLLTPSLHPTHPPPAAWIWTRKQSCACSACRPSWRARGTMRCSTTCERSHALARPARPQCHHILRELCCMQERVQLLQLCQLQQVRLHSVQGPRFFVHGQLPQALETEQHRRQQQEADFVPFRARASLCTWSHDNVHVGHGRLSVKRCLFSALFAGSGKWKL